MSRIKYMSIKHLHTQQLNEIHMIIAYDVFMAGNII